MEGKKWAKLEGDENNEKEIRDEKKEDRKQCDYKGVEKREIDKRSSIRNNEGDRG